jgi:hypothetical protein
MIAGVDVWMSEINLRAVIPRVCREHGRDGASIRRRGIALCRRAFSG